MFGLPSYAVDTDVQVNLSVRTGPPIGVLAPLSRRMLRALASASITLESGSLGAFSLEFEAWDSKFNDTSLLSASQLSVDNYVTISMGSGTSSVALITGPITGTSASFSQRGIALSVTGYDVRHVLRQGMFLRNFAEMSELEIAEAICKERGVSVRVDKDTAPAPPALKFMRQAARQSDYEFITDLLDRVRFVLDVEGHGAVIRPPTNKPTNPLAIKDYTPATLTSFSGSDSTVEQVDGVIVIGRDPVTRAKIEGAAGTVKATVSPVSVITLYRDVDSKASADRIARSELDRRITKKLTASANLRGDATLVPGGWIRVWSVGPFSGQWRITRAVHAWDPSAGYTTALSLEQEV